MKKFSVLMLTFILAGALVACGCQNSAPSTNPTDGTTQQTEPNNMIIPDPTIDTNIPDSAVDPSTQEDPTDMDSGLENRIIGK